MEAFRLMTEGVLTGKKVLIAEDSWHVANALRMTVEGEGGEVVGPSPTVARACRLLDEGEVDLALVDLDLRGEMAYPLLEALAARGIRAVVLSGYGNGPRLDRESVTVLGKPVQPDGLVRAMRRALV